MDAAVGGWTKEQRMETMLYIFSFISRGRSQGGDAGVDREREGGKIFERWRLNLGFRDEFFKATTRQSHWQSIEKKQGSQSATVSVAGDHSETHNQGGLTCCLLNQ